MKGKGERNGEKVGDGRKEGIGRGRQADRQHGWQALHAQKSVKS